MMKGRSAAAAVSALFRATNFRQIATWPAVLLAGLSFALTCSRAARPMRSRSAGMILCEFDMLTSDGDFALEDFTFDWLFGLPASAL